MSIIKMDVDHEPERTLNLENSKPVGLVHREEFLFVVTRDAGIVQFSFKDLKFKKEIRIDGNVLNVLFLEHEKIAAGFDNGEIWIMDMDFKKIRKVGSHNDEVVEIVRDFETGNLISASEDCSVVLWNEKDDSGEELYRHSAPILVFGIHLKTRRLISGCSENILKIYSLTSGLERTITLDSKPWSLGIVQSDSNFVIGDHDGNIIIFNFNNLSDMKKLDIHESRIRDISIKSDEKSFFTVSFDQTAAQISFEGPKKLKVFNSHKDWIRAALYVNNDYAKNFITAGDDGLVCFWKAVESDPIQEKTNHGVSNCLKYLGFSAGCSLIVLALLRNVPSNNIVIQFLMKNKSNLLIPGSLFLNFLILSEGLHHSVSSRKKYQEKKSESLLNVRTAIAGTSIAISMFLVLKYFKK
jgi:WD40 repeat protein